MPLHNCYSKIQVRFCNVKNLLFAMLIAAYHSTMPVYCFMQLFPRRISSKAKAFVHILVCFVLLSSFHMIKVYWQQ